MRALLREIEAVPALRRFGRVARIEGLLVEVTGAADAISLGGEVRLTGSNSKQISCDVAGFGDAGFGDRSPRTYPSRAWRGRAIDAFGRPTHGKGALPRGTTGYPLGAQPPPAHARARIGGKLAPGREGLARNVAAAEISDEPALVRRHAAYVAMSVAGQLWDQGLHGLLLMDSVTRFAMAQREIGLCAGDPARRRQGRHGCECRCRHRDSSAARSVPVPEEGRALEPGKRVCRAERHRRRGIGER